MCVGYGDLIAYALENNTVHLTCGIVAPRLKNTTKTIKAELKPYTAPLTISHQSFLETSFRN